MNEDGPLLKALSQYAVENNMSNMIKRAAPTANAGFQIDGTTLHSLLRIPASVSKEKPVPELNASDLRILQEDFSKPCRKQG